ncbi:MAG: EthD family reductase [Phreatobacter sp.]|uniref:EthD family reductase n=1 Tax=Phreatobacter sp. TaxID=1966341 RepID=UPI001A5A9930|nr:EthD family reductase [Phreatobacter sp.]MBL8567616.1 EthD family reductase [Phreatobacter sp.]
MIKRITIFARRDGLDRRAFSAHWSGPHRAIAAGMPNILGYRQNHALDAWTIAGEGLVIDGMAELWFADDVAMAAALASPAAAALPADELDFMRAITLCRIAEGLRPPAGQCKLILLAGSGSRGASTAQLADWLGACTDLDPRRIGIDRVLATATREALPGAGKPDVIASLLFDDMTDAQDCAARIIKAARSASPPFASASLMLADVLTVVPPPCS